MTLNKQALRKAAESATRGPWEAKNCHIWGFSDNNPKITIAIAELWSRDTSIAQDFANSKFIAAANPTTVLALLDELEAAEKRIAELEARTVTLPTPYPKGYGLVADKYNFALEKCADAIRAAGIGVKGE
ncbi:ead/Ea22-like family protein [Escherichia coli]|nr:ead/Ea22-like family protein [Escherichia coli]